MIELENFGSHKYVLLREPSQSGENYSAIIIIDNSTEIGKRKVVKYLDDGYDPAGIIVSDLSRFELKRGFSNNIKQKYDECRTLINGIQTQIENFEF